MFVGRLAGMVGFRTHTFTRIGSIMDKKQSGSTKLAGLLSVLFQNVKKSPIFSLATKCASNIIFIRDITWPTVTCVIYHPDKRLYIL